MVKTENARCGHSFEDMLKDYIDCEKSNDATSESLTDDAPNVNNMSEENSSESTDVEHVVTTITIDDVFEVECSTVAEEVIIEDVKVFDTSSPNPAIVEVVGNDCMNELQSPIVEDVEEIITDEPINSKHVLINNEFDTFFDKIPANNDSALVKDPMEIDASLVPEIKSQNANDGATVSKDTTDDTVSQSTPTENTIEPITNYIARSANEVTDKPYKCHICGKLFSRNSSLKCHIRLHVEGPDSLLRGSSEPVDSILKSHIVELNPKKEEVVEPATEEKITDLVPASEVASCVLNSSRDSCDLTEDEDKRDYKCIICEKTFSRRSSLTCHYKFHPKSPISKSQEDIRVETVSDEATMEVDQSNESANEDEYKCEKCDRTFSQKNTYAWHLKMHETNVRKDSVDSTSNVDLTNGINHTETIDGTNNVDVPQNNTEEPPLTDVNTFKCPHCPRSFPQLRGLKTHSGVHKRTRVSEQYKNPEILNTIIYEEVSSRKYTCCTKHHNHDDVVTKLYKCNVCYKCFCDMNNLKAHLARNHQKEDTSEASDSDHVVESLNNTVATVDDSSISPKATSSQVYDDIKEQKVSLPIRGLYKCGVCNETFDEIQQLGEHVTVHIQAHTESLLNSTDDSAAEELCCVVCEKTFRSQNALNRHMNEHRRREEEILVRVTSSGRKIRERRSSDDLSFTSPIKCLPCNRTFETKRAKRVHDSSKHPVEQSGNKEPEPATEIETDCDDLPKVVVCECCNRQWTSTKALNRHKGWNKRKLSLVVSATPAPEPPAMDEVDPLTPDETPIEENKTESDVSSSVKCGCCNELFPNIPALNAHLSGLTNGAVTEAASSTPNHEKNDMASCDSLRDLVKCDRCDKFCSSIPALKLHIISDHTKKSTPPSSTKEPGSPKKPAENIVPIEPAKEIPTQNEKPAESIVHSPTKKVSSQTNDNSVEKAVVIRPKIKRSRKSADVTIASQQLTLNGESSKHNLLQCDLCDETFTSKRAFNSHKSTHVIDNSDQPEEQEQADVTLESETKTFACCDKTFSSSRALKAHQSRHSAITAVVEMAPAAQQQSSKQRNSKDSNLESTQDAGDSNNSFVKYPGTDTESEEDVFVDYKCTICEKRFASRKSLRYHREKHFQPGEQDPEFDGEFSCDKCHKKFDKKTSLSVHKAYHTTLEKMSNAPIDYGSYSDMRNGIFKCNECDREFDTIKGVSMHFTKTHKEPESEESSIYTCSICDRYFSCSQGLAGHMSRHKGEASTSSQAAEEPDDLTCVQCDKSFLSKTSLKKHCTTYHDNLNQTDPECICKICKKAFVSKCNLQRHRRFIQCEPPQEELEEEQGETETEYPCAHCDKIFTSYRGLNGHMQMHQVYLCSNCNQEFITFRSYKLHMESQHTNEEIPEIQAYSAKEFACDKCDKVFLSAKSLGSHKAVHYNKAAEKSESEPEPNESESEPEPDDQFRCDKCDRSFATARSLGGHKAMHTKYAGETESEGDENESEAGDESAGEEADNEEEQPTEFSCTRCDRTYNSQRSLKIHLSTHATRDNPLELTCPQPQCNRVFISQRALSAHFLIHRREAGIEDFPCPKCKETFPIMKTMYDHFYAKHKRAKKVERVSRRSLSEASNDVPTPTVKSRSRSQVTRPVVAQVRRTRSKSVGDCARSRDKTPVKSARSTESWNKISTPIRSARSTESLNKITVDNEPASSSSLRKSRRLRSSVETTSAAHWSAEMTVISEQKENQPMDVDTETEVENGDEAAGDNMQLSCVFNDSLGDVAKSLAKHMADSHESTNPIDKKYDYSDLQVRIHQCTKCDKIFPSRVGLRRHSLSHSEPLAAPWESPLLNFQCPLCPKILSTSIGLKRHSLSMHKTTTVPQITDATVPLPNSEADVNPEAIPSSSIEQSVEETEKSTNNGDRSPIKESTDRNESSKPDVNRATSQPADEEIKSSKSNLNDDLVDQSIDLTERSPSDVDLTLSDESLDGTEFSKSEVDPKVAERSVAATECLTNGVDESSNVTNTSSPLSEDQIVLSLDNSSDGEDEPVKETTVAVTNTESVHSTSNGHVDPTPPAKPSDDRLSCKICSRKFDHVKAFNKHVQWHKFNDRAVDIEESVVVQDPKPPSTSNGVLTNGTPSLDVLAYVKCDICERTFTKADTLKEHAFRAHSVTITSPILYLCNFCHKPFPRGRTLFVHLQSHGQSTSASSTPSEEIMPFECASCEKCFRLKDDLLEHVKTHLPDAQAGSPKEPLVNGSTIEEPRKMNGTANSDSGHSEDFELKIPSEDHQQVDDADETNPANDSGPRPDSKNIYECPHCVKKYPRKCYLVTHLRSHTKKDDTISSKKDDIIDNKKEERKAQPTMRRRSIKLSDDVESSLISPPKPYQCSICDKSFRSKSVLAVHEQKHSTVKLLRKSLKRPNEGDQFEAEDGVRNTKRVMKEMS